MYMESCTVTSTACAVGISSCASGALGDSSSRPEGHSQPRGLYIVPDLFMYIHMLMQVQYTLYTYYTYVCIQYILMHLQVSAMRTSLVAGCWPWGRSWGRSCCTPSPQRPAHHCSWSRGCSAVAPPSPAPRGWRMAGV